MILAKGLGTQNFYYSYKLVSFGLTYKHEKIYLLNSSWEHFLYFITFLMDQLEAE